MTPAVVYGLHVLCKLHARTGLVFIAQIWRDPFLIAVLLDGTEGIKIKAREAQDDIGINCIRNMYEDFLAPLAEIKVAANEIEK